MSYNHYKMQDAVEINPSLERLPVAEILPLEVAGTGEKVPNYKVVKVTDCDGKTSFVYTPKHRYVGVQHKQAFRPIIDGLTMAGEHNYKFCMVADHKKAQLQIYVGGEGYDTVCIGINVLNSLDGTKPITYGFEGFRSKKQIEIVAYRLACKNGMKIKVPIGEGDLMREELVTKITTLFEKNVGIKHTGLVTQRIEAMQFIVEAMVLLRQPVENMIKAGQKWTIDSEEKLDALIKTHVGKRYKAKVLEQYEHEEASLWGLFNAITHVASHDAELQQVTRDTLLEKASNMLLKELTVPTPSGVRA